ncbi:zincin [Dothidotthia symphoricarpi CBS 119687]|uniref:Zincin n=1 Tax=Dothidotthia symphoricarpi CBS 119687 TaxID=1392245 RepID=A0A6A6AV08_9PLEO|nr:zincin [Dothidotthia symphoricarpi CBS 119687]KAF2135043.1 zincin [Dothidotthia symphoricarpi CBS 119687]
MVARFSALMLLGASAILAGPLAPRQATVTITEIAAAPAATAWNAGAVNEYTIHRSCNATQHAYIRKGLTETITICRQARDHILRWGNSSEIYQKYFGDAATGEAIGWYTKIVDGDKADVLFRCDNPDGNCDIQGWAGHWRGSNATSETVICDPSYELRRPLEGMCMHGYTVATGATNFYWASDLLHRLLHVPSVGEGVVEHYGEHTYPGVLELAQENATYASRNSDSLQYFALEVYAHDVAIPGEGCPGRFTVTVTASATASATGTSAASATGVVVSSAVSSVVSSVVSSAAAVATSAAAVEACTPHNDHWHCPPGVPEPASPPA